MCKGMVTGKGKDAWGAEIQLWAGFALPLQGCYLSPPCIERGAISGKCSCEDLFSFEVWGENHPFLKNLSRSRIQTQTVPAPRQSGGISEHRQCRATRARCDEGNVAIAWPGFIMSLEETLPVSWDPQRGYLPGWGQGGREAACSWSPGPRPSVPLACLGLEAFTSTGPPR